MTYSTLLINSCVVERYSSDTTDGYGNPVKVWTTHLEGLCRLSYPKGRQIQRDTEVIPIEAVAFLEDADITEYDRITIDGILFEILFVAKNQDGVGNHHCELSLKRVIP